METVTEQKYDENLALDDERRVKVLSPSALVAKRFFANKLALVGLVIIVTMFLFAFLGGLLMPYNQAQVFTIYEPVVRDYVNAAYSDTILTNTAESWTLPVTDRGSLVSAIRDGRDTLALGDTHLNIRALGEESWLVDGTIPLASVLASGSRYTFSPFSGQPPVAEDVQTAAVRAINGAANTAAEFEYNGNRYSLTPNGRRYTLSVSAEVVLASKLIISPLEEGFTPDYALLRNFEAAIAAGESRFGGNYAIRKAGETWYVSRDGIDQFAASRYSIQPMVNNEIVPAELRTKIEEALTSGDDRFEHKGITYLVSGVNGQYSVKTEQSTLLVSLYEKPSAKHWLGTDKAGMDVVVRLMYGGRVSLLIGFVVILIEIVLAVIMGGLAGYFGKAIDMLIMRIVDIITSIPSLPLYIIIGVFMDQYRVDPNIRIYVLMLVMGFMSWPGTARVVRGQILSLREQEFMVAAEALGLRTSRRIFRHLVPNVIPQLIVIATMGLGDVIIAESTLSFLGLGVKFPLASWGNILDAVNDVHVMTNYLYVWIPAGFCILITVLGFNFVGDGLRDAFDPKLNR